MSDKRGDDMMETSEVKVDGVQKEDGAGNKAGGEWRSRSEHFLDDAVDSLVKKTVDRYLEEFTDVKDRITRTQLAAIVRYTETFGGSGLLKLIKNNRDKYEKNEKAKLEKKGGKKPKYKQFWELLKKVVGGDLKNLAGEHSREKEVYVLFASRLAIELNYRNQFFGVGGEGKHDKAGDRDRRKYKGNDRSRRDNHGVEKKKRN